MKLQSIYRPTQAYTQVIKIELHYKAKLTADTNVLGTFGRILLYWKGDIYFQKFTHHSGPNFNVSAILSQSVKVKKREND